MIIHTAFTCRTYSYRLLRITIAQCFCWCGVITLNHLYHAIEESIWAIGALFVAMEMGSLLLYHPENQYLCKIGLMGCVMCLSFFWFMITVDVPMYIRRWQEGQMEKSVVKMNVGTTFTRIALPPRPCRMTSMDMLDEMHYDEEWLLKVGMYGKKRLFVDWILFQCCLA